MTDGRRNPRLTPEQRSERARQAALARWGGAQAAERATATVAGQPPPPAPPVAPVPPAAPAPPAPEPEPVTHDSLNSFMSDVVQGVTRLDEHDFSFMPYLPQRLRDRFGEASASSDQLSNAQQIALVDLRVSQLLERIDTTESGRRWYETKAAMREFVVTMRSGDQVRTAETLTELNSAINRGVNDADNWAEIMQAIEVRRRVTETELRRIRAANEFMSAQEALALITLISESVNRHVDNLGAKALIAADIAAAIGASGA